MQVWDKIDKWKVCCAKVSSEHAGETGKDGKLNVVSVPFIVGHGAVCSMTYLVLSVHDTEEEALNAISYIKTKFTRFLISTSLNGMNMTSRNYMFVPIQDYRKPWTDNELYKKYNLTQEEIDYIENKIKSMQ